MVFYNHYNNSGIWLVVGLFLGVIGVIPIALIILLLNSEWSLLFTFITMIVFICGFRLLGLYLGNIVVKNMQTEAK